MRAAAIVLTVFLHTSAGQTQVPPPILDMHLHAQSVSGWDESVLPVAICAPFDLHVGVDTAITPDSLRRLVGAGKVEVPGAIWNWYTARAPIGMR